MWWPLGRWLGSATAADVALQGPSGSFVAGFLSMRWREKADGKFSHITLKSPKFGASISSNPNIQNTEKLKNKIRSCVYKQIWNKRKGNFDRRTSLQKLARRVMSEDSREIWLRLTPLATAIFFFFSFFFDKKSEECSSKGRSVLCICYFLFCLFCFVLFRFGEPHIVLFCSAFILFYSVPFWSASYC